MIELDGSHGEGGGQILRSALALSILTGKPFKLVNVRAGRKDPGLRPSHVMSVKSAAQICGGRYTGVSVGSSTLSFEPGEVTAGRYTFSIGTAGATGLVLHTIYLPLALRGATASELTITGGTHVSTSPCYHYNAITWVGHLKQMGIEVELEMSRAGFYPRGGGEIRAVVHPCSRIRGVHLMSCPELTAADGFSSVSGGLPEPIAKRQARRLAERLKREGVDCHIEQEEWAGGPGTVAAVQFGQLLVPPLFFSVGERGKPAETVADAAADQAIAFRAAKSPVDPHAADQIVLPLALSPDASEYRTSAIDRHLTTNIDVIRRFVDRDISCEGAEGEPGVVRIAARDL